jgi:hypothetical protein
MLFCNEAINIGVPETSPGLPLKHEAIAHHPATHCLNCGAAVAASYCQHCGQATAAHVPSASEFLHEFVGHYIALESKLWTTLVLLLFKPGRLTLDYIQGKRVRYVEPLRVYLTLSVLFFAVFNFGGGVGAGDGVELGLAPKTAAASAAAQEEHKKAGANQLAQAKTQGAPASKATAAAAAQPKKDKDGADDGEAKPQHEKDWLNFDNGDLDRAVASISPRLVPRLDRFRSMTSEEQKHEIGTGFAHFLPYAIFAMMPVFALWLKLMYLGSGRLYGEHLLFALHTNAFAFLTLTVMVALPSVPFVKPLLILWLVFYLPTAMRRVYGGGRVATFARWMLLGFLHMLGMAVAMLGAVVLAVLA